MLKFAESYDFGIPNNLRNIEVLDSLVINNIQSQTHEVFNFNAFRVIRWLTTIEPAFIVFEILLNYQEIDLTKFSWKLEHLMLKSASFLHIRKFGGRGSRGKKPIDPLASTDFANHEGFLYYGYM